ncbi:hypothetical protein G3260_004108 [Streptomyces albus]|uniref:Uncharacterized protein n=1 Tax=Streptomyces albus TaxID=1888 RepID=A0A6C1C7V0_9ACTN|nr:MULTISPECIES: hypothetical protein [Streptomyces]KPC91831.1 hypothetical protein ADL27_26860 [Streptomyces sp. NRRL F-6602]QID37632.1 hypothetical protein G3260_004108 [Streptomyces albus]TGG80906.1 hypothetical protein D8771_20520 [Streptomyces albus]UVN55425.1 hypothetical protein NR995_13465 [Streptomyces albus]
MTTPPQPPPQPPSQPQQPAGGGGFGPPAAGGFGQPPAGYGQPPAGYGQPPAGYGQPPAGFGPPANGPAGFGQPGAPGPYGGPPAPPPNKSNKVVALVLGAVLVVALAVGGTLLFVGGDDSGDDKAEAKKSQQPADDPQPSDTADEPTPTPTRTRYELAFPKTLEGGKYRLRDDLSDSVDTGKTGEEAHLGSYSNAADTSRLLYGSATGEDYGNPEFSKNQMMNGMESGAAMDVAVKRRDITPAGAEDPLTCEVLVKKQQGRRLTIPVCAWSDPGTAAYVANDSLDTYSVDPEDVDLEAWAERVDAIRDEVRTPAT